MVSDRGAPNRVRAVVVAIHGILTRTTDPGWPDALDAFLECCKVERRSYFAGVFATWNVFVANRWRARVLAEQLLLIDKDMPLHFVAHSNGCDIALKTIKRLAQQGRNVDTMILVSSVTDPDVVESGVADLVVAGHLSRAVAYCSDKDFPLRLPFKWPYKNLGVIGWQRAGKAFEVPPRFFTRMFKGYGHTTFFGARRAETFQQICADLRLDTPEVTS